MCGHPNVFLHVGILVYEENAACTFRVEGLSTYRNTRGQNQDLDLHIYVTIILPFLRHDRHTYLFQRAESFLRS